MDLIRTICERCRKLRVPIEVVTNGYELDSFLDIAVEYEWGDVQVTMRWSIRGFRSTRLGGM